MEDKTMNKIYVVSTNQAGESNYRLVTESGQEFDCTRWYEKKTNKWYVKLPKDNPSGREYITESLVKSGEYEFETKTAAARVLGPNGNGGWKSRLTEEEKKELESAEKTIERLKETALARKPYKPDLSTPEGIKLEIERLLKAQAELLKAQG